MADLAEQGRCDPGPQAARTTASSPRSPSLRSLVSTCPRSGSIFCRSEGRSARSWPSGAQTQCRCACRTGESRRTAHRGIVAARGYATTESPSRSDDVMSFAEWHGERRCDGRAALPRSLTKARASRSRRRGLVHGSIARRCDRGAARSHAWRARFSGRELRLRQARDYCRGCRLRTSTGACRRTEWRRATRTGSTRRTKSGTWSGRATVKLTAAVASGSSSQRPKSDDRISIDHPSMPRTPA